LKQPYTHFDPDTHNQEKDGETTTTIQKRPMSKCHPSR
jgi:hypothetical protein